MSRIDPIGAVDFDAEVLESSIPVFVKFTAEWCMPCKAVVPTLEDVAREFEGEVRIVSVDVDAEPSLAETYAVKSLPAFLLFNHGKMSERYSGLRTRSAIAALFERYLAETI